MGTSRTSNKDILTAIEAQSAVLGRVATALEGLANGQNKAPAPQPSAAPSANADAPTVDVDRKYMEHQQGKAAEHAQKHGAAVVGYARRNMRNETKIAYCLASRWDAGLSDRRIIGPVFYVSPTGEVSEAE